MSQLLISKNGIKVREIELKSGTITTIGRARDNDIQLNDPTVSGHHAKIVTVMDTSYIEDLDSKNGVLINGERAVVQALQADDVISIGRHQLLFREYQDERAIQNENMENAGLVASVNGGTNPSLRYIPAAPEDSSGRFKQYSSVNSAEPGLRVVVDNTGRHAQQRPLDIDINVEKFANEERPSDVKDEALYGSEGNANKNIYVDTFRYSEVIPLSTQNHDFNKPKASGKYHEPDERIVADVARKKIHSGEVAARKTVVSSEVVNEEQGIQPGESGSPMRLTSRQPFMDSEEVVKQLIALGREKNKAAKKSRSFASLLVFLLFLVVTAAIYFQLQKPLDLLSPIMGWRP
jgi:pSer/pThr/pTyr-binding forkhead associated (FHA) protein